MITDDPTSQRTSVAEASNVNLSTGHPWANVRAEADVGCCNVYVANLPPSADAPAIRRLFETVGKVLHVKLLLDIASGVSRGIAFVMFENVEVARRACATKNKVVLDGNVLQVRQAERSSLHNSPNSHVRSAVVYIRNVPGNITHEVVKRYCEENFGPVVEVSPHPQSAELKGPSPFNMDFVVFRSVDDACRCVESVDGRSVFPMPPSHPFTMAKMITDVAGEMRKSILLRRRSSDNQPPSNVKRGSTTGVRHESRRTSGLSTPHVQQINPQSLPVNPQFQPFVQPGIQSHFHHSGSPVYHMHPGHPGSPNPSNISVPSYDAMGSPYLDTSVSQRSSLDTSMLQSQRGSLLMNQAHHVNQPYPLQQMVPQQHSFIAPHLQHSAHIPHHAPQSAVGPSYYQHIPAQPQLMGQARMAPINTPGLHSQQQIHPQILPQHHSQQIHPPPIHAQQIHSQQMHQQIQPQDIQTQQIHHQQVQPTMYYPMGGQ